MTGKSHVVSLWRLLLGTSACTDECLRCGVPLLPTPPLVGDAKRGGSRWKYSNVQNLAHHAKPQRDGEVSEHRNLICVRLRWDSQSAEIKYNKKCWDILKEVWQTKGFKITLKLFFMLVITQKRNVLPRPSEPRPYCLCATVLSHLSSLIHPLTAVLFSHNRGSSQKTWRRYDPQRKIEWTGKETAKWFSAANLIYCSRREGAAAICR